MNERHLLRLRNPPPFKPMLIRNPNSKTGGLLERLWLVTFEEFAASKSPTPVRAADQKLTVSD